MILRLFATLAFVALLPAAAAADDPRGSADTALAGKWALIWNMTASAPRSFGGHYVQVYSDRRVHWTDSVRDINSLRTSAGGIDVSARCEDSTDLSPADLGAMRDVARAIYDLQLPDGGRGLNNAFLELTVTRGGHDYVAGIVNYGPEAEDLDPRLKRVHAIFARYACPSTTPAR